MDYASNKGFAARLKLMPLRRKLKQLLFRLKTMISYSASADRIAPDDMKIAVIEHLTGQRLKRRGDESGFARWAPLFLLAIFGALILA